MIDEDLNEGLHQIIDETEISGFIEDMVRPHVPNIPDPERGVADLLAMPEASDIDFESPHLDTELYRKSEAV